MTSGASLQSDNYRNVNGRFRTVGTRRGNLRVVGLAEDPPADLISAWASAMRSEGKAIRTIGERTAFVARVEREMGIAAHELLAADVAAWFDQDMGASTRCTYFGHLRAWFSWLVWAEHRDDNPMEKLRTPHQPRRRPRPISTRGIEVLLASRMHRRTRMMILLITFQGLRISEACTTRGEDVDVLGETFSVTGKGGAIEVLPLHPVIATEAADWPRRGWWFPSYADPTRPIRANSGSDIVSKAMRRAGVKGTAHSCRHWYGTELHRAGADARTIQTLLRHASLATISIYTDVSDDERRAAVLRLPTMLMRAKGLID